MFVEIPRDLRYVINRRTRRKTTGIRADLRRVVEKKEARNERKRGSGHNELLSDMYVCDLYFISSPYTYALLDRWLKSNGLDHAAKRN